jgi:hypothetical protein
MSPLIKLPYLPDLGGLVHINEHYEEEMEKYITLRDLVQPLSFSVENGGSVLAQDVRIVIKLQSSPGITVIPWGLRPRKPKFRTSAWALALEKDYQDPDIWTAEHGAQIHVMAQIDKIQPGRTSQCWAAFYICGPPGELQLEATVSGDNLPAPMKVPLKIAFTVAERTMSYAELTPPLKRTTSECVALGTVGTPVIADCIAHVCAASPLAF